ncbi:hypothetical protein [Pseudovibrio sp. SCP19]|uniref:hypothetical protein n=1 Tax=Pseudovibrio sp. SCP19 TaxID=3141374 RepID=UPI00333B3D2E
MHKAKFERITQGAQITLYPCVEDTSFADRAADFSFFIKLIEQELEAAGIKPGATPDSDVGLGEMGFATYRNQAGSRGAAVGEKEVIQEDLDQLKNNPFYKAVTGNG